MTWTHHSMTVVCCDHSTPTADRVARNPEIVCANFHYIPGIPGFLWDFRVVLFYYPLLIVQPMGRMVRQQKKFLVFFSIFFTHCGHADSAAVCLLHQDYVWKSARKWFYFHKNDFDGMPCTIRNCICLKICIRLTLPQWWLFWLLVKQYRSGCLRAKFEKKQVVVSCYHHAIQAWV